MHTFGNVGSNGHRSVLNAFSRFTARRGKPQKVISDNGGNFVGSYPLMKELWASCNTLEIIQKEQTIDWRFNAPISPHQGGFYERLIACVKIALKAILTDAHFTKEEFNTALCLAESAVNNRPLTVVSADVEDLEPITPSHFMIGLETSDIAINPKTKIQERWNYVQLQANKWWKRFLTEVVPNYNLHRKWRRGEDKLHIDDIVLSLEDDLRGVWPLARIVELKYGPDGIARTATIRRTGKTYVRSVNKLGLLQGIQTPPWEDPEEVAKNRLNA